MSDAAKEEMYDIMGPDFIEELSVWPDYVRSEPGWKFADPWHYTTVHMGQTPADVRRSYACLLYTSPSPRDRQKSRMPSSA